jgi:hypothetical protein
MTIAASLTLAWRVPVDGALTTIVGSHSRACAGRSVAVPTTIVASRCRLYAGHRCRRPTIAVLRREVGEILEAFELNDRSAQPLTLPLPDSVAAVCTGTELGRANSAKGSWQECRRDASPSRLFHRGEDVQQPFLHPDRYLRDDLHWLTVLGVDGRGATGAEREARVIVVGQANPDCEHPV